MSGFQVGDVVVCVDADESAHLIILNGTYRVASVIDWQGGVGLILEGIVRNFYGGSFGAYRFRKIRPASDEFITALRACKPKRVGEPA